MTSNPLPPLSQEIQEQLRKIVIDYCCCEHGVKCLHCRQVEAAYRLRDAEVQRLQEGIDKLNERIEELRAPEEVDALLDKLHTAEALLAETRKELTDTQAVAKRLNDDLASERDRRTAAQEAITQHWEPKLAEAHARLRAMEQALREIYARHNVGCYGTVQECCENCNIIRAALSPAPAVPPQEVLGSNPCPTCGTYLWRDTRPCWYCAKEAASRPAGGRE